MNLGLGPRSLVSPWGEQDDVGRQSGGRGGGDSVGGGGESGGGRMVEFMSGETYLEWD